MLHVRDPLPLKMIGAIRPERFQRQMRSRSSRDLKYL